MCVCVMMRLVSAFLPAVTQHWYLRGGFGAPAPVCLYTLPGPLWIFQRFGEVLAYVSQNVMVWFGLVADITHPVSCQIKSSDSFIFFCPSRAKLQRLFLYLTSFTSFFPPSAYAFSFFLFSWSHMQKTHTLYNFQHTYALISSLPRLKSVFFRRALH